MFENSHSNSCHLLNTLQESNTSPAIFYLVFSRPQEVYRDSSTLFLDEAIKDEKESGAWVAPLIKPPILGLR